MRAVAFPPSGYLLATAGDHWARADGMPIPERNCPSWAATLVVSMLLSLSPDGKTLATGAGDKTISLWDVATGKELTVHLGNYYGVITNARFGPDGELVGFLQMVCWRTMVSKILIEKYVNNSSCLPKIKVWDIQHENQF